MSNPHLFAKHHGADAVCYVGSLYSDVDTGDTQRPLCHELLGPDCDVSVLRTDQGLIQSGALYYRGSRDRDVYRIDEIGDEAVAAVIPALP